MRRPIHTLTAVICRLRLQRCFIARRLLAVQGHGTDATQPLASSLSIRFFGEEVVKLALLLALLLCREAKRGPETDYGASSIRRSSADQGHFNPQGTHCFYPSGLLLSAAANGLLLLTGSLKFCQVNNTECVAQTVQTTRTLRMECTGFILLVFALCRWCLFQQNHITSRKGTSISSMQGCPAAGMRRVIGDHGQSP